MLIFTVVDEAFEGAKTYENYCRADNAEEFRFVGLPGNSNWSSW